MFVVNTWTLTLLTFWIISDILKSSCCNIVRIFVIVYSYLYLGKKSEILIGSEGKLFAWHFLVLFDDLNVKLSHLF